MLLTHVKGRQTHTCLLLNICLKLHPNTLVLTNTSCLLDSTQTVMPVRTSSFFWWTEEENQRHYSIHHLFDPLWEKPGTEQQEQQKSRKTELIFLFVSYRMAHSFLSLAGTNWATVDPFSSERDVGCSRAEISVGRWCEKSEKCNEIRHKTIVGSTSKYIVWC